MIPKILTIASVAILSSGLAMASAAGVSILTQNHVWHTKHLAGLFKFGSCLAERAFSKVR